MSELSRTADRSKVVNKSFRNAVRFVTRERHICDARTQQCTPDNLYLPIEQGLRTPTVDIGRVLDSGALPLLSCIQQLVRKIGKHSFQSIWDPNGHLEMPSRICGDRGLVM